MLRQPHYKSRLLKLEYEALYTICKCLFEIKSEMISSAYNLSIAVTNFSSKLALVFFLCKSEQLSVVFEEYRNTMRFTFCKFRPLCKSRF